MSVQVDRGRWVVRWRDASGRQRGRRFAVEEEAQAFDREVHSVPAKERTDAPPRGAGVYHYRTAHGLRWYFKARGGDGSQITRRGFPSRKTALEVKRHLVEQIARGEARHTQETFAEYWERWLERRRRHVAAATYGAYEVDGRKRLLPTLGPVAMKAIQTADIRGLAEELAEHVEAGEIAGKTVNNTLTTLTVCLNAAVKDGVIATNPAAGVQRFPRAHVERDYLRMNEIPAYLDACSDHYRPLAALLIGTGTRISEALALRASDLQLEPTGGWVTVHRAITQDGAIGSTKSKRPRAVEIGPQLARRLEDHLEQRQQAHPAADLSSPLFIAPGQTRRRHAAPPPHAPEAPPDRRIVSGEWHRDALRDAGLRHMPLHSLRHTAAAAWLAAGNPLLYVQKQLGHQDLATTSHYYGHLERHHNPATGAQATEEAIARASTDT